jgi:uncharacterized protein (TIGR03663 family)
VAFHRSAAKGEISAVPPGLARTDSGYYPIRVTARKLPWIELGILLVALVLRVAFLDIKPAHFDEGVNGWFADQMTRQGFFRYDPENYHGPLHFYSVFLCQTLFGRNLWALRISALVPSLLAVWAILRFREFFGPVTVRLAALAMAVSTACVFYGRYSIHESWMMLFQILFLWGILGVWQKGERRFYLTTVFAAVGMMLIKETYVIHVVSFALAALVLGAWQKVVPSSKEPRLPYRNLLAGVCAGLGALLFIFFALGLLMSAPHPQLFAEILSRLAEKGLVLPSVPWEAGIGVATALMGGFWVWAFPRIPAPGTLASAWTLRSRAETLGIAFAVIVFFYSGNLLDWSTLNGVHDTFLAWFHTGVEAAGHEKTAYDLLGTRLNYYWIRLLWLYEWPALLGFLACFRYVSPADARLRYLAIYAGGVLLAFSLIPYKTPWCLLSIVWPFFLLFGALIEEASRLFTAENSKLAPVGLGILLVLASLAPSVRLNFFHFDDPKEPYVYVQTFRECRTLTDPVVGMAKQDPRFYHVKGQLYLDSYYPLPWVFGEFTQLGYFKSSDNPAAPNTSDFVVAEKKDEARIESALSGLYFKRDFRLRDAQGDCVVYFRAVPYGKWFRGETPQVFGNGAPSQEGNP